jgi:monoamine oxidase
MKRIAIIGAGVSGLAAAEKLARYDDVEIVLFEARNRMGGRAFTDATLRDAAGVPIPFDWGCHWIHGVEDSPLSGISEDVWNTVKNSGYRFEETQDGEGPVIFNGGEKDVGTTERLGILTIDLPDSLDKAIIENDNKFNKANLAFSASEVLWRTAPEMFDNPLLPLASWLMLTMEQGKVPSDFLAADYVRAEQEQVPSSRGPRVEGGNGLVPLGLGALIQVWGQLLLAGNPDKVRLHLQAPVSKVKREGDSGKYRLEWREFGGEARQTEPFDAVIVTVPTEVIRRKHLKFEPALPEALVQAFDWLPMGNYKKVALQFPPGTLQDFANSGRRYLTTAAGGAALPVFVGLIERGDLAVMMTFDQWASHLDALPPMEVAKAAVEALRDMVGNAVSMKTLVDFRVTDWRGDPYSLGAYAYTQVGENTFSARTRLVDSMKGNTLVFAGEAITEVGAGAAHGAFWSGDTAAEKLAETLGLSEGVDIVVNPPDSPAPEQGPKRITLTPGGPPTRIIIRTGE